MSWARKPRVRKAEQTDKSPLTHYWVHTIPIADRQPRWTQDYHQFVSIDPGINNIGFRVERRYLTGRIITVMKGETPCFDLIKPDSSRPEYKVLNDLYHQITSYLLAFLQVFHESHIFLIERQPPVNYMSVRVSQHILSFFSIYLRDSVLLPSIYEVDPKMKGQILNAPPNLNHNGLKKWSVEYGIQLLRARNDHVALDILAKETRKHDKTDVIVQIEAVAIYFGLVATDLTRPYFQLTTATPVKEKRSRKKTPV